jgi:outer membrane protein assembly factor BamB
VKKGIEQMVKENDADGAYAAAVAYLTDQDFPPLDLRTELPVPVRIVTRPPGAHLFTKDGADTGLVTGPSCIVSISIVKGATFDVELAGFKRATVTIPAVTDVSPAVIHDKVRRSYHIVLEKTVAFRKGTTDGRPVTAAPFASKRYAVVPSSRSCEVVELSRRQVCATLQLNGDRSVRAAGVVVPSADDHETVVVPTGDGALMFFEASSGRSLGTWSDARGGLVFDLALAGGDVIAADDRGGVYCVNVEKREKRWSYAATTVTNEPTSVSSAPVVSGGEVYVGCADGAVHVLDLRDGQRVRILRTPVADPGRVCAPVAVSGGCVWFASRDASKQTRVTKWNLATGRGDWSVVVSGEVKSAPMPLDGTVFLVTTAGEIHGLKALDGSKVRSGSVDRSVRVLGEAILDGDLIYVGCDNGTLYAMDVRGTDIEPLWRLPLRSGTGKPVPVTTRCVAAGGFILFGAGDSALYAVEGSN